MSKNKKKIVRNPKGSRDWLPEEVYKQEYIRQTLVSLYELWGYKPIQTPILINRDSLTLGSKQLTDRAFNLSSFQGESLSLRADLTTPIARAVAERFEHETLPIRLFYVGKVFRAKARKNTNERELYQVGTELIGSKEGNSDIECLKIFMDSVEKLGLKNYLILINHTHLWEELIRVFGEMATELYKALSTQDLVRFKNILSESKLSKSEIDFWVKLIDIKGGKESLKELKLVSSKIKKINLKKLISYYEKIFNCFGDSIHLDLSYTNDIGYYTGLYFELVTPDIGRKIGAGGRYDNLIGKFGYDVPAIGFSFCLEDILLALEKQNKKFPEQKNPKEILAAKDIKKSFQTINKLHKRNITATLKL